MGVRSCPVGAPHTQVAVGLEQFVILTRVTFGYRDSSTATAPCVERAHPWLPTPLGGSAERGTLVPCQRPSPRSTLTLTGSCLAISLGTQSTVGETRPAPKGSDINRGGSGERSTQQ